MKTYKTKNNTHFLESNFNCDRLKSLSTVVSLLKQSPIITSQLGWAPPFMNAQSADLFTPSAVD